MDGVKEARVSARIDQETKNKAEEVLTKHGLSISEFIRMNLTTVANQGLPDYYGIPNQETIAAIEEGRRIANDPSVNGYNNLEDLIRELES